MSHEASYELVAVVPHLNSTVKSATTTRIGLQQHEIRVRQLSRSIEKSTRFPF